MLVYVQNAKFIGLKLKILHDDLEKDDLYRFTKSNIDSIDDVIFIVAFVVIFAALPLGCLVLVYPGAPWYTLIYPNIP